MLRQNESATQMLGAVTEKVGRLECRDPPLKEPTATRRVCKQTKQIGTMRKKPDSSPARNIKKALR